MRKAADVRGVYVKGHVSGVLLWKAGCQVSGELPRRVMCWVHGGSMSGKLPRRVRCQMHGGSGVRVDSVESQEVRHRDIPTHLFESAS